MHILQIEATLQSSHLRHQYGIFGGKSQTSFSRNATRAGSEEGRLFSQARIPRVVITFFFFFPPSFSKAILRIAELPFLCNLVFFYFQLFVPHFAMADFWYINKQRDTPFEFSSSIPSTVDLSKHLIMA